MNTYSRRDFLKLTGIACSGAVVAGLTGCGGSDTTTATTEAAEDLGLVTDGTLTLVSEFYYPPFESLDDDGNPEGFDVDIFKALAEEMGLKTDILPSVKFDTIIPTIKQGGKADVSLGCIVINDERAKEIAFSDPYLDSNLSVVTKADADVSDYEDLDVEGKQIAFQSGSTGEAWAKENFKKATLVQLDDAITAMTGTQTGNYDGCLVDLPVASYECKNSFTDLKVAVPIPTGEQLGVVVSKDNEPLLKAINKALKAIKGNGKYDEIQETWFGDTI